MNTQLPLAAPMAITLFLKPKFSVSVAPGLGLSVAVQAQASISPPRN